MLNPNAQQWLYALRSGEYTQGHNKLRTDDTFCCLGVACDLFAKANPTEGRWSGNEFVTAENGNLCASLPRAVADWLGMKRVDGAPHLQTGYAKYGNASGQNLVQDNDARRHTFDEISDIIEAHQKELFNA